MTPKEKAIELINKFFSDLSSSIDLHLIGKRKQHAKKCALICVDEILNKDGYNNDYWKEVKQEIEKL